MVSKMNIFAVVMYVEDENGQVLAISRKENEKLWGLVGGKVDITDDSTRAALNREILEETGVDISSIDALESKVLLDDRVYVECFIFSRSSMLGLFNTPYIGPEGTKIEFKEKYFLSCSLNCTFWKYNADIIHYVTNFVC